MRVITLLNEKGGCGKTTLSVHIAAGIAKRGYRVLLIDSDPQAHATIALGMKEFGGLFELLIREGDWQKVVQPVPAESYGGQRGALYLLPSNIELRAIPQLLQDVAAFRNRINELRGIIDFVIVDTPPTPSLLHGTIYMGTDYVIHPTLCEYWSFDGLTKSMIHRKKANQQRAATGQPPLKLLGIVPTMFRSKTVEHSENYNQLREQFGKYVWTPVANRIVWAEGTRLKQPVWLVNPESKAVAEIERIIDQILEVTHEQT